MLPFLFQRRLPCVPLQSQFTTVKDLSVCFSLLVSFLCQHPSSSARVRFLDAESRSGQPARAWTPLLSPAPWAFLLCGGSPACVCWAGQAQKWELHAFLPKSSSREEWACGKNQCVFIMALEAWGLFSSKVAFWNIWKYLLSFTCVMWRLFQFGVPNPLFTPSKAEVIFLVGKHNSVLILGTIFKCCLF